MNSLNQTDRDKQAEDQLELEPKTYAGDSNEGFYLSNDDSATVNWYKWFICYMNKAHVFSDYFDKNGKHKFKCVRCGVEKVMSKGDQYYFAQDFQE